MRNSHLRSIPNLSYLKEEAGGRALGTTLKVTMERKGKAACLL